MLNTISVLQITKLDLTQLTSLKPLKNISILILNLSSNQCFGVIHKLCLLNEFIIYESPHQNLIKVQNIYKETFESLHVPLLPSDDSIYN